MKMGQILTCLLAEINATLERMEAKMDSTREKIRTNQKRMEAKSSSEPQQCESYGDSRVRL
jgi:hypothetical protein